MSDDFWYVPSVKTDKLSDLPKGLALTIFDPANYLAGTSSSEKIQKEFDWTHKATGEHFFNFSPERLALHETIVGISTQLKLTSESQFVEAFENVYRYHVLPLIRSKSDDFLQIRRDVTSEVEETQTLMLHSDYAPDEFSERIERVYSKIDANLKQYQEEEEQLAAKAEHLRPTRSERGRLTELRDSIEFITANRDAIAADTVVESEILNRSKAKIKELVSGVPGSPQQKGFLGEGAAKALYPRLTQHIAENRRGFLVVGGAASGKGSVTARVKYSQSDPHDLVELNPDLYKRLLKPFDEVGDHIELHGSLTHTESSLVLDSIAERWQEMALLGEAPNLLMDVARAGRWMRDVMHTGGTKVEVHSPTLPVQAALERSFYRGQKEGRFMPTEGLVQGHKDQLATNLDAMTDGCDFTIYDTNRPAGTNPMDLPIVARFEAKTRQLAIRDLGVMLDYFQKGMLNPAAQNSRDLSATTPKSTAAAMLQYAQKMELSVQSPEGVPLAKLSGDNCMIADWQGLKQQTDPVILRQWLEGLIEQNVRIDGPEAQLLIEQIRKEVSARALNPQTTVAPVDVRALDTGVERYAALLRTLIERGKKVAKTSNVYLCSIRDKENEFPLGAHVVTINLDDNTIGGDYAYDASAKESRRNVLLIDPKVHRTAEDRQCVIDQLKETGQYRGPGVWMNRADKVLDDYEYAEDTGAACPSGCTKLVPNPKGVRIAHVLEEPFRIPVTWEGGYLIEKDGALIVRESDLPALRSAVAQYDTTHDPQSLLTAEGLAKIDVYGTDPYFVQDNYDLVPSTGQDYARVLQNILTEGIPLAKQQGNGEAMMAYQLKPGEFIPLPQGKGVVGVEGPNWIGVPMKATNALRRDLELEAPLVQPSGPVHQVTAYDNDTIEKSFNPLPKTGFVSKRAAVEPIGQRTVT